MNAAPALSVKSADPSGHLLALFQFDVDPESLTLLSIDPVTGINVTVATDLTLGKPQTSASPLVASCLDTMTNSLVVSSSAGDGVYSFADDGKGTMTVVSPLPPFTEENPFIGLACTPTAIYYLTNNSLSTVGGGELPQKVTDLDLPETANKVVVVPKGGSGAAPWIVIGDTDSGTWVTIDVGDSFAVASIKSTITKLSNLHYSPVLDTLVALSGYNLYTVDPFRGTTKNVASIDGASPAYLFLKVNAVDPSGQYFVYFDFYAQRVIDLTGGYAKVVEVDTDIAPRLIGQPQWFA